MRDLNILRSADEVTAPQLKRNHITQEHRRRLQISETGSFAGTFGRFNIEIVDTKTMSSRDRIRIIDIVIDGGVSVALR